MEEPKQFIVSENNRSYQYFSSPYFNLYLTKDSAIVVPLMSRFLQILSTLTLILSSIMVLDMARAIAENRSKSISTTVLLVSTFVISTGINYVLRQYHLTKLRRSPLKNMRRSKHYTSAYDDMLISFAGGRATITIDSYKIKIDDADARKLQETIARIKHA